MRVALKTWKLVLVVYLCQVLCVSPCLFNNFISKQNGFESWCPHTFKCKLISTESQNLFTWWFTSGCWAQYGCVFRALLCCTLAGNTKWRLVLQLTVSVWDGGGEQDGSRMIVACETHACLLRGSGGMPSPQENFEFTSSQIASDTIYDKMSKQHFDDTYLCSVTCN